MNILSVCITPKIFEDYQWFSMLPPHQSIIIDNVWAASWNIWNKIFECRRFADRWDLLSYLEANFPSFEMKIWLYMCNNHITIPKTEAVWVNHFFVKFWSSEVRIFCLGSGKRPPSMRYHHICISEWLFVHGGQPKLIEFGSQMTTNFYLGSHRKNISRFIEAGNTQLARS